MIRCNNCLMALRLSGLKTEPAGCKNVRAAIRQIFAIGYSYSL
ncbi:hypothetical protein SEEC0006_29559 [Salmonella enterica subsp. enterica serovar Choleraesuis str. 0006]|uniref:Uncharacterized protein n=17 Tax=Salmonella enterica I TaxID=59201 RepID=A0A6C8GQ68_SALET|nr:hypothetical protein SPAB_01451 [Salmonella enterica subsp. enterica serovar Paratyphi B str. SPB7]ACF65548.1 hypothetical protein SNSL254_A1909 [Salmonella enterica subsp. enterica serovar Newport str. SL254]ACF90985.1 hypothetical protein SeSA_A1915 [Salmonella enterica subsp. enterica serovar Schwarzengrund str. CVM19633]ACH49819.1 hypothetical protein SeAg_B1361 [Salmonella enterica subsp. enterica serovar Agona str. SL483]ACH75193.1 hypothetical protein SeD_A1545 [Salmonella enterica su